MHDTLMAQTTWLRTTIATLEDATAALPMPERRNWVGDAQALYALNLARLHGEAQTALEFLRAALAATLRALQTLAERG